MSHQLGTRRAVLLWFLLGSGTAAMLQIGQAQTMGGTMEGLLFVGSKEPAHQFVVEELPHAPIWPSLGHDGQIFYAIALDLGGEVVPDALGSAAYRYRRILYPALASGFGMLDGTSLLVGMVVVSAVSVGSATAALAGISQQLRLPIWSPVAILFNPGIWLSTRLLTADGLALAFALLSVWAFINRRHWLAIVGLGLAALTKEPYLAFAVGLAATSWTAANKKTAIKFAVLPMLVMSTWWIYVGIAIGNPVTSGSQTVVVPMSGLATAVQHWPAMAGRDIFYMCVTLSGFALATFLISRRWDLWSWLLLPWLLIAASSAQAIWLLGNNATRAFAPVLTLAILGMVVRQTTPSAIPN